MEDERWVVFGALWENARRKGWAAMAVRFLPLSHCSDGTEEICSILTCEPKQGQVRYLSGLSTLIVRLRVFSYRLTSVKSASCPGIPRRSHCQDSKYL